MDNLRKLTEEEQKKAQKVLRNYVYANNTDGETIKIADADGEVVIGEVPINVLDNMFEVTNELIKFT